MQTEKEFNGNESDCVSIIIACYNAANTVGIAIESVANQSYKNIEIIVVDDGSTDSSISIVSTMQMNFDRIRFIQLGDNRGVSYARNIGLASAQGRYICFLDADDYLLEDSIVRRVNLLKKMGSGVVFGSYIRKHINGRMQTVDVPDRVTYQDMLKRNQIGNLTGMYDTNVCGKVSQQNIRHEDYLMWVNILSKCTSGYSVPGDPLAVYTVSNQSLSGNKIKSCIWHWVVLRKGLDLPIIEALWYQMHYIFGSVWLRLKLSSSESM